MESNISDMDHIVTSWSIKCLLCFQITTFICHIKLSSLFFLLLQFESSTQKMRKQRFHISITLMGPGFLKMPTTSFLVVSYHAMFFALL